MSIDDIEVDQPIVSAALAANSSAAALKKACWDARSVVMWPRSRLWQGARNDAAEISACRTDRDGATTCPSRCVPWERGRATDTCPTTHRVRAHRRNTCGRERRPPA